MLLTCCDVGEVRAYYKLVTKNVERENMEIKEIFTRIYSEMKI